MHDPDRDTEKKGMTSLISIFNIKKKVKNSILSNGINFSFVKTANYFSYWKGHVAG